MILHVGIEKLHSIKQARSSLNMFEKTPEISSSVAKYIHYLKILLYNTQKCLAKY